jgi:hypothetical protein
MLQKLKLLLVTATIAGAGGLLFASPLALAAPKDDACVGINQLSGTKATTCSGTSGISVSRLIKTIIQILSVVVGFAAVIMVIVGGLKMITANGDSSAIASARSTITYALIGLIIVAMAQVLVHFVIFKTANVQQCPSNPKISATDSKCK